VSVALSPSHGKALLCPLQVENYFSELAQQMGYKPSERMVEARARRVDWAYNEKHKTRSDRGYALKGSRKVRCAFSYGSLGVTNWWFQHVLRVLHVQHVQHVHIINYQVITDSHVIASDIIY
jgi:hypothetical protein